MRNGLLAIVMAAGLAGPTGAATTSELLRCQKALHTRGSSFVKGVQTLLTSCALKVEACELAAELDGANPTQCLAAASTACQTSATKIAAYETSYRNKVLATCAPVPLADLEAWVAGLGFFHEAAACGAATPTDLVACLFANARCGTERVVFALDPRAQAAFTAAGIAAAHPCVAP